MLRFLRESVKEFDHVVWPTRRETVRYFTIVLSTITVFTVFLFIVGSVFTTSLFTLRDAIHPASATTSASPTSAQKPAIDLKALLGSGATKSASWTKLPVTATATGSAQ